jgi:hypothetical protein
VPQSTLTAVDFAAEADNVLADSGTDNRAILLFVVDYLIVPALNVLTADFTPWSGKG